MVCPRCAQDRSDSARGKWAYGDRRWAQLKGFTRESRLIAPFPKEGRSCSHSVRVGTGVLISLLTLLPSCPSFFINEAAGQFQPCLTSLRESISYKFNANRQLGKEESPQCVFPSPAPKVITNWVTPGVAHLLIHGFMKKQCHRL